MSMLINMDNEFTKLLCDTCPKIEILLGGCLGIAAQRILAEKTLDIVKKWQNLPE